MGESAPMSSGPRVQCPDCGKLFRWVEKMAGKKVLCPCGVKMRYPHDRPGETPAMGAVVSRPAPSSPTAGAAAATPATPTAVPAQAESAPASPPPPTAPAEPASTAATISADDLTLPPDDELTLPTDEVALSAEDLTLPPEVVAEDMDQIFDLVEAPPPDADDLLPPEPPPPPPKPAAVLKAPLEEEESDDSEAMRVKAAAERARHLATLSPVERALLAREDEVKESKFRENYLPWVFIAVGMAIAWIAWTKVFPTVKEGMTVAGILLIVQVAVFLPLAFFGTMLTAKWMEVEVAQLIPTVLKTAAVTLGPGAISDVAIFSLFHFGEFEYEYILVGFVIYIIPCGPPAAIMFRMGLNATVVMISFMVIPRFAALFFAVLAYPKMFGVG